MTEAVFLYNPVAGRFPLSERRLKLFREKLYCSGIRTKAVATFPNGHLGPPLDLSKKELLVVYGGDGTIHQAIQEAVRWKVPLALLPGGTANVLAKELGIPSKMERALDVVARRKVQRIYLGQANGSFFHLMAGIGLDAYIIGRLSGRLKRATGVAAYWYAGLTRFWQYPLKPFELRIDGEARQPTFAVIGNARNYGGQLLLTPQASVYEPCLDVCMFLTQNRFRFIEYLLGAFQGRHVSYPEVIYRKAATVQATGEESILVQMDGELVGHLPKEFSIFSEGIEVIVP